MKINRVYKKELRQCFFLNNLDKSERCEWLKTIRVRKYYGYTGLWGQIRWVYKVLKSNRRAVKKLG